MASLFLMEFLVDSVDLVVIPAIHDEKLRSKICVSFQILDLPPLNIYEESSDCKCESNSQYVFKKGKSCLFALSRSVLEKSLCSFPVNISVYKEFPFEVVPDVILIGSHQIQACSLINQLLEKKTYETMKNTFKITTATGQCVGHVTVFIRASYFADKIITEFQIPEKEKPYLFKSFMKDPIFQCKRIVPDTQPEETVYEPAEEVQKTCIVM